MVLLGEFHHLILEVAGVGRAIRPPNLGEERELLRWPTRSMTRGKAMFAQWGQLVATLGTTGGHAQVATRSSSR